MANKKDKNCTTIFMVSPLGVGRERLMANGYIGAYLGDVGKPELKYEKGVYLLFKPEDLSSFEDFLYEERERGALIAEDYDYEGGYVVVVYLLDDKFEKDWKTFIEGKYSEFSYEFKSTFPLTIIIEEMGMKREEITLQQRIFNKHKSIRDYWEDMLDVDLSESELWSKPKTSPDSEEYLDIKKIRS